MARCDSAYSKGFFKINQYVNSQKNIKPYRIFTPIRKNIY